MIHSNLPPCGKPVWISGCSASLITPRHLLRLSAGQPPSLPWNPYPLLVLRRYRATMAWTGFSAEAVDLDTTLRKLHREGRVSEAIGAIKAALARAYQDGPSNISYEEFERSHDPGSSPEPR